MPLPLSQATASPSMMQECERIRASDSTISGKRLQRNGHRMAFRHPAASASASVQNQRLPFVKSILIKL
jgi:hypothetical protein